MTFAVARTFHASNSLIVGTDPSACNNVPRLNARFGCRFFQR